MPAVTSLNPKKNMATVQNKQLPYTQSNQMLPVRTFTPAQLEQGSQNVMGTAQQTAIKKASQPDPTMGLVQQQTQQLIKEPELITDKYIKGTLGRYDRERANQMTAFQQLYADTANTGTTREAAYNFAMEGAQGKTDLENQLRQDQAVKNRQAKFEALNLGMTAAKTGSSIDTEAFNRLISTSGAYEGARAQTSAQDFGKEMTSIDQANRLEYLEADQEGKLAITALQGKIQNNQLLTQQDFVGSQAALDRALADATSKGDRASAENIIRIKGDIEAQAQETQREWLDVQNSLDRESQESLTKLQGDIQKGILLTGQDFAESQSALDRALVDATNKGDRESAEKITKLKGQIDAQAQESQRNWLDIQNSLDRESKESLTKLQGDIQKGLLLTGQDFEATQNGLGRDLERYRASGDWENAEKITNLRGQIDAQAQEAQREWSTSERIATQSWTTDARIDDQQFNRATQVLDQRHEIAVQNNDIDAMQQIEDQRQELQLTMQLQDFSHDEKITKLSADIAEAQANNDVGRQKQLMGYQSLINLKEMAKDQGYKVAQMNLQQNIQEALQNNQHTNAMSMLDSQQKFAAEEAEKDRVLEHTRVELQKRGVDAAELEQRYNLMAQEDPDGAFKLLQGEMNKHGIKMNKAEEDASLQAIADDYRQQQFVYALSHPDQAVWVDANGNPVEKGTPDSKFGGLKDGAVKTFNEFLNKSYYGPDGKIQTAAKQIDTPESSVITSTDSGNTVLLNKETNQKLSPDEISNILRGAYNPDNPNNATYQQLLNEAPVASISISSLGSNSLSGVPAYNSVINVGGRLMVVTGGKYRTKKGRGKDAFQIMDVGTGAKKTFTGLTMGDDSVNGLDKWANELP